MNRKLQWFWIWISLPLLYLSLNIHGKTPAFNYRSEIFADKAGYYVYLPAFFIYQFDARNFPKEIDKQSGKGFAFLKKPESNENTVVFTKYPMGVALMDLPFFAVTHAFCKLTNTPADGFGMPYFRMRTVSNWFYTFLGLGLIIFWLKRRFNFSEHTVIVSVLLLLFGTNLLYYSVKDVGLSHNYSFFLVALFLNTWGNQSLVHKNYYPLMMAFILGLMMLVRPINAIFIGILLLPNLRENLKPVIKQKWQYSLGILWIIMMFLPQLIYYKYSMGAMMSYSYGNETFAYLSNPKILQVLFAFENGWLTNNPLFLLVFVGLWLMYQLKNQLWWMISLLIASITWLYASWWSWELGCAFGHRGFIDFYPAIILPIAYSYQYIQNHRNQIYLVLFWSFVGLSIAYNLKLTFAYDGCWLGNHPFDTLYWRQLLFHTGFVK